MGTVKGNEAIFLACRKNEKVETMIRHQTLKGESDNMIERTTRRELAAKHR